jgi:hypothetical protein
MIYDVDAHAYDEVRYEERLERLGSVDSQDNDREELATLERRLTDITAPSRQVPATEAGNLYRERLRADIRRLRLRVEAEGKAA